MVKRNLIISLGIIGLMLMMLLSGTTEAQKGKDVHILKGTETEAWKEELDKIEAKIKDEEEEIANLMDKMKSKSGNFLEKMLLKDKVLKGKAKEEKTKECIAAIRILGRRIFVENKDIDKFEVFHKLRSRKNNENKEIRREVFFILRKYQLEKKVKYAPSDSLIDIAFDKNKGIKEREDALKVLGMRREEKEKIIPILKKGLEDKNKTIQMFSALSLYKLGEISIALPILDRFLKEGMDDATYITSGVDGLVIFHEEEPYMYTIGEFYNEEAVKILLKRALKYNNESIRLDSIIYLRKIGEEKIAYQSLIKFLKEAKDPELKKWVLTYYIKPIEDEKMIEVVKELSKDKNKEIREEANKVLEEYYKMKR